MLITVRLEVSWQWAVWAATVQSLLLVSTQLWKTRWVLLALAASRTLSVCSQTDSISVTRLIMWMCTVPICLYLCVRSLHSGWYVVVHMLNVSGGTCRRPGCSSVLSSPRPGAAQWVRLAQKTPFLRGKWSVHDLDQWYCLPLLLPPSSSFSSTLGCNTSLTTALNPH